MMNLCRERERMKFKQTRGTAECLLGFDIRDAGGTHKHACCLSLGLLRH